MLTDQQNHTIDEIVDEMGAAGAAAEPCASDGSSLVTFMRTEDAAAGSAIVLPDGKVRGASPSVVFAVRAIARREAACSAG